jgi:CzcA family heavy metal efflux pump
MIPSAWIVAHRRSILFLLALVAGVGLFTATQMAVSLFPTVDFPRVVVSLDAGDRPAEQMLLLVTTPVEEAVRRVPGVQSVRSTTSRGVAEISINFGWGLDMASATLQINAAITQILPTLPTGTQMSVKRMDPTAFPIIAYSLTSTTRSLTELHDLAQFQLRPQLSNITGVARVQVVGGAIEEYRVDVQPQRLQAFGLSIDDVARALNATNVVSAVGRLEDRYKLFLVVSDSRLRDLDSIRQTIVRTGRNGVIHLDDIASVTRATMPQWIRVTADGRDAVLFQVYQQPGSNSVQIAADVRAKLASMKALIPPDVKVANWYDQSVLVLDSAASVRDAILIGIALAAAVLFAFLRNLKITLIAIVAVPTVLAATVVLLDVAGMNFNIMTLGGMAAAVGLIIDDAIVMIEHIVRRLRGSVGEHHGKVMAAATEFARPLAGSSAATIVIFIPLAFLTGVTGAFFKALSLTMASGLVISFLVAFLAVPLLGDRFLNERDANQEEGGRVTDWLHERYSALMRRLLARPWLLALGIVPLLALGALAYQHVGSGFMPAMDEGGFILDYRSKPGTALSETDRLLRQVEAIVRATPEVETFSRRTGTGLGGGLVEANEGDFFIRLKPPPRRPIDAVMQDIRTRIERQVPGLSIEMAQLMEDMIGDLTAVPQPIEIKLFSDDPVQLGTLAVKVAAATAKIRGVVDVRNGINPAGDALDVSIDRTRAALEGVDPDSATRQLSDYLSGTVTTQLLQGPKTVGVRVWVPGHERRTPEDIALLRLKAGDGHLFPLERIATITAVTGQPQINRDNLKRMVAVTGRISGRSLGSVIADVKTVMARPGLLPSGVYFELGGLYQQQQIAFKGLILVFMAALALVFVLLLFLYERFRVTLAIMAIPLLSISGVFIGLWVAGVELNISAMMGMTMIVGIVTEAAVFYFSEYEMLSAEGSGSPLERLILAGKNRMRPIAMTTVAAILTLLPLALAIGQGSAMQQPLAVAIIAGLTLQLPLVLLVMPVIYWMLERGPGDAP